MDNSDTSIPPLSHKFIHLSLYNNTPAPNTPPSGNKLELKRKRDIISKEQQEDLDGQPLSSRKIHSLPIDSPPSQDNYQVGVVFKIVVGMWATLDVSDICWPAARTCRILLRLSQGLVEQQASAWIRPVAIHWEGFHFNYCNLRLNGDHDLNRLESVMRNQPNYRIHSLNVQLQAFSQERVNSDLKRISDALAHQQQPYSLSLVYKENLQKNTNVMVTIPGNVSIFTFVVSLGEFSFQSNLHNNHLQQLELKTKGILRQFQLPMIKHLILGINSNFGETIAQVPLLTHLKLSKLFNTDIKALEGINTLESLSFASMGAFNHPLDHLPQSLKKLNVGYPYSHPLDNLPLSLEVLTVKVDITLYAHDFNHLPPGLTHLSISVCRFYKHHFKYLPIHLQTLFLSCATQRLQYIPPQLLELTINSLVKGKSPMVECPLPNTLQSLTIKTWTLCFDDLPPSLLTLDMATMAYFSSSETTKMFTRIKSHPSIHTLILPGNYNEPFVAHSLCNLRRIEYGCDFQQEIELPDTVEHIKFNTGPHFKPIQFNRPLGILPPKLKSLVFDGSSLFDQCLSTPLPATLKDLELIGTGIPACFKKPREGRLSSSNLVSMFRGPIGVGVLPEGLQTLALGSSFAHGDILSLPESICTLYLRNEWGMASDRDTKEGNKDNGKENKDKHESCLIQVQNMKAKFPQVARIHIVEYGITRKPSRPANSRVKRIRLRKRQRVHQ